MHRHVVRLGLLVLLGCPGALAGCDSPATTGDGQVTPDAGHAIDGAVDTGPRTDTGPRPDANVDAYTPPALDTGVDAFVAMADAYVAPMVDAYVPPTDSGPRPDGCSPAIAAPTPGVQTARMKGATCAELGYYEYVPSSYSSRTDWPLIIALHGDGEVGNGTSDLGRVITQGLPLQIQNDTWDPGHRFVVLSPQMADIFERRGDVLQRYIAFAIANYDVDPHRIYLTGYSGGAEPMENYLATTSGGIVAAVLPISGYFSMPGTECSWRQVPIWYFHGANDSGITAASANSTPSYDMMQACSPGPTFAPRYTLYANRGHDDWNLTYDLTGMNAATYPVVDAAPGNTPYDMSIYDWFLTHTR